MEDFEEKLNSILSSPETMGQIMALANSLSGAPAGEEKENASSPEEREKAPPPAAGENPLELLKGLEPAMLGRITALYREYARGGDEKTALLQAMRPFLREERREKLEKAVQIARLSRVIRAALEQFKGERYV